MIRTTVSGCVPFTSRAFVVLTMESMFFFGIFGHQRNVPTLFVQVVKPLQLSCRWPPAELVAWSIGLFLREKRMTNSTLLMLPWLNDATSGILEGKGKQL